MKKKLYRWFYIRRSNLIYHILKHYIKKKCWKIIKLSEKHGRGIGKTYNLVRLSSEFNIPLIVPTFCEKRYILDSFPQFTPIVIVCGKLNGISNFEVVLVDEKQLFDENTRRYMDDFTPIQIGFETRRIK